MDLNRVKYAEAKCSSLATPQEHSLSMTRSCSLRVRVWSRWLGTGIEQWLHPARLKVIDCSHLMNRSYDRFCSTILKHQLSSPLPHCPPSHFLSYSRLLCNGPQGQKKGIKLLLNSFRSNQYYCTPAGCHRVSVCMWRLEFKITTYLLLIRLQGILPHHRPKPIPIHTLSRSFVGHFITMFIDPLIVVKRISTPGVLECLLSVETWWIINPILNILLKVSQ